MIFQVFIQNLKCFHYNVFIDTDKGCWIPLAWDILKFHEFDQSCQIGYLVSGAGSSGGIHGG